ncbi:SAM-dependent methyltransferase [Piscinibacter sakaiensis]|uniref:Methyltransferase domain-containing protein n=1 Tax=Piscinibacter sakaiensis TaxID=1547922 RepID=A0A0K8NZU5_PISS1|nr:class I SAM-dependent methyltransferase [Piscinibacter sakaiensis]GAP35906.1 hypothetical protein ISF6_1746 [Piscinibacter sakaiensis]
MSPSAPTLPAAAPSRARRALAASCLLAALALPGLPRPAAAAEEVPFITTPDHVTLAMLELAGLRAGEHLIDLGSGDGRIVITAARRFGASGLGVELDPALVQRSRAAAQAAGVQARTEFREQDLFATDLARAQVITMYLLPAVNLQLRPRLLALAPGTRIVSHDWDLGDWAPERTLTLDVPDKAIGLEKRSRVHLWVVPARVDGRWCGPAGTLTVTQRFQAFSATYEAAGLPAPLGVHDGRILGTRLSAVQPATGSTLELEAGRDTLTVRRALGGGTPATGAVFQRAGPQGCPADPPARP